MTFDSRAVAGGGTVGGAGGPGLAVSKEAATGDLQLAWGSSCSADDTDFGVYRGAMSDFSVYDPVTCSTGGAASFVIAPGATDEFFLVVPSNAAWEGSFGVDSSGAERPPSANACGIRRVDGCP